MGAHKGPHKNVSRVVVRGVTLNLTENYCHTTARIEGVGRWRFSRRGNSINLCRRSLRRVRRRTLAAKGTACNAVIGGSTPLGASTVHIAHPALRFLENKAGPGIYACL